MRLILEFLGTFSGVLLRKFKKFAEDSRNISEKHFKKWVRRTQKIYVVWLWTGITPTRINLSINKSCHFHKNKKLFQSFNRNNFSDFFSTFYLMLQVYCNISINSSKNKKNLKNAKDFFLHIASWIAQVSAWDIGKKNLVNSLENFLCWSMYLRKRLFLSFQNWKFVCSS